VPDGWKVEEHKKGGQIDFDPAQVLFHLSTGQMGDKSIKGNELRKELADEPVLNANVLDYLLAHSDLIPEEWKTDTKGNTCYIFFWGTIYRYSDGRLFVRCLYWSGGGWGWICYWLGRGFGDQDPAALRAS